MWRRRRDGCHINHCMNAAASNVLCQVTCVWYTLLIPLQRVLFLVVLLDHASSSPHPPASNLIVQLLYAIYVVFMVGLSFAWSDYYVLPQFNYVGWEVVVAAHQMDCIIRT